MANDGQRYTCPQTSDIPVLGLRKIPERPDAAIVCEALALGDSVRIDGAGARKKEGTSSEGDSNIKQQLTFPSLANDFFHAHFMHRMGWEYVRS